MLFRSAKGKDKETAIEVDGEGSEEEVAKEPPKKRSRTEKGKRRATTEDMEVDENSGGKEENMPAKAPAKKPAKTKATDMEVDEEPVPQPKKIRPTPTRRHRDRVGEYFGLTIS